MKIISITTERDAIRETIKMWSWIAKNPGKGKWEYLDYLYKVKGCKFENLLFNCGCCEYYIKTFDCIIEKDSNVLNPCPLAQIVPSIGDDSFRYVCGRQETHSIYNAWVSLYHKVNWQSGRVEKIYFLLMTAYALQIVNHLQEYWDANFKGNKRKESIKIKNTKLKEKLSK